MSTSSMFKTIALWIILIGSDISLIDVAAKSVGVNFGRLTSHKLLPSVVADICLANGIEKVKFFSVNDATMSVFSHTNINITVSLPNVELFLINGFERTRDWVQRNISHYILNKDVHITHVCVGVEPFSKVGLSRDASMLDLLPQYIQHLNLAIKQTAMGFRVMVTVPHATDVLMDVEKPSDGDFRDDIKPRMIEILRRQAADDGPFMINIYPLWSVIQENRSVEFGLFDGKHNESIQDGSLTYTNIFDFKYDTLLWALRKNRFGRMKVVVGQVGWPTDGGTGATVANAKRFYDGFLRKIANKEGTPLQPGVELDVYVHSLVDENQRNIQRGPFERHYGIFTYDGKPKFNIDFTLQGRDIIPQPAQGVTYMPQRWCLLDKEAAIGNEKVVEKNFRKACSWSDCSLIFANESTCSHLDDEDKVSYAFNIDFQQRNQDVDGERACHYDGLGKIVQEEPEMGECKFPVQILSTLLFNSASSNGEMAKTLGTEHSHQGRLDPASPIIILPVLLCLLYFSIF